jgi:HPr kinase/phosphorylase
MAAETPTVHASAVLAGAHAVLIRGPAGAGKSQLALALIQAADTGLLRFARLIGDDRLHLEVHHGRLLVRPAAALAGLIEVRGLGIRRLDYEPVAVVGLVVGAWRWRRARPPSPRCSPSCMADRTRLNLGHDPCGRVRWYKSNRATVISCPTGCRRAPLPQCNTLPESPERPLHKGFGSS